jgi:uncharacterized protein YbjT (DUF2867 family)
MQDTKKIAVAGATGRVGSHTVDVLRQQGYDVVEIARAHGVDVITGEGLAEALAGVEAVIDAATGPSPEERAATEFFTTAARNLQQLGEHAGVQRIVVVSIIGTDRFTGGYGAAKIAHERSHLDGPVPVHILRASQFHEFVEQLVDWGRQGDVSRMPVMRTQLVAARSVADELAALAPDPARFAAAGAGAISEIAGPREERLAEMGKLVVARRGEPLTIEEVSNPDDPDREINEEGGLLPGPDAKLAGPTFEQWLAAQSYIATGRG